MCSEKEEKKLKVEKNASIKKVFGYKFENQTARSSFKKNHPFFWFQSNVFGVNKS